MNSVINTLTWEPISSKKDLEKIVLTNNGGVDVITFKVEIKGLKDSLMYNGLQSKPPFGVIQQLT